MSSCKKGQFQPGISGNLKGRPKKSLNQSTIMSAALNEYGKRLGSSEGEVLQQIIQRTILSALEGDMSAIGLILARISPTLKPVSISMSLGNLPEDILAKGHKITTMACNGEIPIDIARELITSIGILMSIKEKSEIEDRLLELENKLNKTGDDK